MTNRIKKTNHFESLFYGGFITRNSIIDENQLLVESVIKNGGFETCYQQNDTFFNKKALFFDKRLASYLYSYIFA